MAITVRDLVASFSIRGNADKELTGLDKAIDRAKRGLATLVAAGAAAGAGILAFAGHVASSGDEVAKNAKRIGVTAEAFQELGFAAKIAGSSPPVVTKAIQTMSKAITDARIKGTGPFIDQIDDLGISLAEFEGLTPDQAFERLADVIAGVEDPIRQAALAQDFFGRGGRELLPLLKEGASGIRDLRSEFKELGGGFTNDGAAAAEEFVDAQTRMTTTLNSLKIAVGVELFPVIQSMIDSIRIWAQENRELIATKAQEFVRAVIAGAKELLPIVVKVGKAIASVVKFLGGPQGLIAALIAAKLAVSGFQLVMGAMNLAAVGATGALRGLALAGGAVGVALAAAGVIIAETERRIANLRAETEALAGDVAAARGKTDKELRSLTTSQLQQRRRETVANLREQGFSEQQIEKVTKPISDILSERETKRISDRERRASEGIRRKQEARERKRIAEEERKRRRRKEGKGGGGKPKDDEQQEGALSPEDRALLAARGLSAERIAAIEAGISEREREQRVQNLLQRAGVDTGVRDFNEVLDAATRGSGPGGPDFSELLRARGQQPVVTVNVTNVTQDIDIDIDVNGVPGQSAREIGDMVQREVGSTFEREMRQAIEMFQGGQAR